MAEQNVGQEVRGTESITSWYDCSRPMWIDLVGDYAGKELFLIEGDSLLRECFEDDRIDFDGMTPLSTSNLPIHSLDVTHAGSIILCISELLDLDPRTC